MQTEVVRALYKMNGMMGRASRQILKSSYRSQNEYSRSLTTIEVTEAAASVKYSEIQVKQASVLASILIV